MKQDEQPREDLSLEDEPLQRALGRVGARGRYLEPERCLRVRSLADDRVALEEEGLSWVGSKAEALARLAALADGAGGLAFRAAFADGLL